MRKTITRTLIRTTAPVFRVSMVNGAPVTEQLESVTLWGKVNTADVNKAVRKAYGDGCITGNIEQVEETYRIGIAEFVAAAVKVENDEEENEEDDE